MVSFTTFYVTLDKELVSGTGDGSSAGERKYGQYSVFIPQLQGHWEHPT